MRRKIKQDSHCSFGMKCKLELIQPVHLYNECVYALTLLKKEFPSFFQQAVS